MNTKHTPTVRIAKSDLAMERIALGDAIEREKILTARVAELEKALTFIQSQAYLGIGEQQPDADQFFRVIEETARTARAAAVYRALERAK